MPPSPSLRPPPLLSSPLPAPCQWPTHKIDCKKPEAVIRVSHPAPSRDGGAPYASPTRLPLEPAADPAELVSLIRTFLAVGGGPRASGIEAQFAAAMRLSVIAGASVADALAIVSAEGLLRRVERNLAEPAGGYAGLDLAYIGTTMLFTLVDSKDAAVCVRVVEERDLLRALVLLVARGPRGRGDGSRAALSLVDSIRLNAVTVLGVLSTGAANLVSVCAHVVDALPDADLQALVDVFISQEIAELLKAATISFLACCLCHAPLLPRLVGAGLPLGLAKLLACEELTEHLRSSAAICLRRVIEAAREHGPPLGTWAKPIVKPLRTAFVGLARGVAPRTLTMAMGVSLSVLACDPRLIPAVASGLPNLVSSMRGGGILAAYSARIIGNLAGHPGARTAALREGAVPAIVSLFYGKDGILAPSVAEAGMEDAACGASMRLAICHSLRIRGLPSSRRMLPRGCGARCWGPASCWLPMTKMARIGCPFSSWSI